MSSFADKLKAKGLDSTIPATASVPESNLQETQDKTAMQELEEAVAITVPVKMTFAERAAARLAEIALAKGLVPTPTILVSNEKPVPAPIAEQQLAAYVDPKALPSRFVPLTESGIIPPKPKLTFAYLVATFREQQFTKEEAEEEAQGVLDLTENDGELALIWQNSSIPLNSKQLLAVANAKRGINFVLTGAAGTGKTTAQAAVVETLDQTGAFGEHDFKYIGTAPSIAIVAFTKVAVRNIQKAIKKNARIAHYSIHCMTIHSLLEFEPVIEERRNEDTGQPYDVRIFKPQRNSENPLTLTHLIIEEASMVGLDLWKCLWDALTPGVQIIFLGDINQLQPVFSQPILGYALVKLPVIQLTRVYRQALDNPIIFNAHRVLKGEPIMKSDDGKVRVVYGAKVKMGQNKMSMALPSTFKSLHAQGDYDPEQDMILLPWNKQDLGVKSMNEKIATILSGTTTPVYCVQGGMNKWYLAVGDKVLVDKRQGKIVAIKANPKYVGGAPLEATFCTRDGTPILTDMADFSLDDDHETQDIDYSNFTMENIEEDSEKRASTHIVSVEWADTEGVVKELTTSGDFGASYFQLGYCMTVHKAQGSEWRKVYMVVHWEHKGFLCRELMYTCLTRAREVFTIFGDEATIALACLRQDVQGDSLEAKINYFNGEGGLPDLDRVPVSKGLDEDNDWLLPYGSKEYEQEDIPC